MKSNMLGICWSAPGTERTRSTKLYIQLWGLRIATSTKNIISHVRRSLKMNGAECRDAYTMPSPLQRGHSWFGSLLWS